MGVMRVKFNAVICQHMSFGHDFDTKYSMTHGTELRVLEEVNHGRDLGIQVHCKKCLVSFTNFFVKATKLFCNYLLTKKFCVYHKKI